MNNEIPFVSTPPFTDDFKSGEYTCQGHGGLVLDAPKHAPVGKPALRIIDYPSIGFGFHGNTGIPIQTIRYGGGIYLRQSGMVNFDLKQKGAEDFSRVTFDVNIHSGREAFIQDLPFYFTKKELKKALRNYNKYLKEREEE